MKNKTKKLFAAFILGVLSSVSFAQNYSGNGSAIIDILEDGGLIFGVFVPRQNSMFTVAASAELARNDQVDYFFLDMESDYNPDDVATVREGIDSVPMQNRPTLLVRLQTIDDAGYEQTFQRIAEVLERGADGIVFPHIRSASMAAYVSGYMRGLGVDVWSPEYPDDRIISFYMIEDPYAVADAYEIAEVGGYSILSCGIGSLSSGVGSPEQG